MRLIDADAVLKKLVDNGWLKMDRLKDSAEMIAVHAILDDAPTIEPDPNNPLTLGELQEIGLMEWLWVEVIHPSDRQTGVSQNNVCILSSFRRLYRRGSALLRMDWPNPRI